MSNIRQSNLELLRIVSMFYIVIYHFFVHAVIPRNPQLDFITTPIISIIHIGVICFVLISGYWGIKFSLKGFLKLFITCSFYSILIYLVYIAINPGYFSVKDLLLSILPTKWWFINVYACLFLLTPIINIPLQKATQQQKTLYIILLTIISYGLHYIPSLSDGKNPVNFILIYYLGHYLRRHVDLKKIWTAKNMFALYNIICVFVFTILLFLSNHKEIRKVIFDFFFQYYSLGIFTMSIIFFLCFLKLNIQSKAINWIAASTLSVYLIHEDNQLSPYLYKFVNDIKSYVPNTTEYFLVLFVFGVVVFMCCILIDKLVNPIIQIIEKLIFETKIIRQCSQKIDHILIGATETNK